MLLIAASCTSEGGEAASPSNVDDASVADGDVDVTREPEGSLTIWLPSSLALDTFMEAVVANASLDATVIEEPATYEETDAAARAALSAGHLVMVPATIGFDLVNSGDGVFVGRLFEDDDPLSSVNQLGVWFVAENDTTRERRVLNSSVSANRRQTPSNGPGLASEVADFAGAEADALSDSYVQGKSFEAAGELLERLAGTYSNRVGGSLTARTVAKAAGPVAAVLDFSYTMYQLEEAVTEMVAAEAGARTAAYDTGLAASAMTSSAILKLNLLEAPFIAGDISAADARLLVEVLTVSIGRADNVANASAEDLEGLGDEADAAQIRQLQVRRKKAFNAAADALLEQLDGSEPEEPQTYISVEADAKLVRFLDNLDSELALRQIASVFVDTGEANESMHSDGRQTVVSAGETDVVRAGQFWWTPAEGGLTINDLAPCGSEGGAHTLCGRRIYDGIYTVAVAQFAADLPFESDQLYQYALVFDRDGDPGDNYAAGSSFPSDTWDQTDLRYEVTFGAGNYGLNVTEGPNFGSVTSGARILIDGSVMTAFIPQDELSGGPTDPLVPMRVTTFSHLGDFGQNSPFNIDVYPPVGQSLWMPAEVVSVTGPMSGFVENVGPTAPQLAALDEYRQAFATNLPGFPSAPVPSEDPTLMIGVDECTVNEFFFDNPTALRVEREAFQYEEVSIQVRFELHDSPSAARGASGLTQSQVSLDCRTALLTSSGVAVEMPVRQLNNDAGVWDSIDLDASGTALRTSTFSFFMDDVVLRVTTVGPPNDMVDSEIIGAIGATFGFGE